MEKLATKILSRLSSAYPSFVQLEECRQDICEEPAAFKRGVSYLLEKELIEIKNVEKGECDGIFGEVRANAAGLDYLAQRSRKVKAFWIG